MNSVSKVAARIRKLLSLSRSTNAHEAAAAAARAQELLQQYKLSEADVEATAEREEIVRVPLGSKGFMSLWRFVIASNAARAFFCECIGLRVGSRRKVVLIGKRNDAEIAASVYSYLVSEVDRLGEAHEAETGCSKTEKLSFIQGATMAVVTSLQNRTKDFQTSSETAMTVVSRSTDELRNYAHKHFGQPRPIESQAIASRDSFFRGQEEGSKIQIPGYADRTLGGEAVDKPSVK